jgi:hypothetical protein
MSRYQPNSITLYLQPINNQQPYQINNCANWLVGIGYFKTFINARNYLSVIERVKPWIFRNIMSKYYDVTEYKYPIMNTININTYRTSKYNHYGDEPHMYI